MKKVSIAGDEPQTLLEDIPGGRAAFGSWANDRTIIFSISSGDSCIQRIPDTGAQQAETLVSMVSKDDEAYYCYPQVLPGGEAILYSRVDPNVSRISCVEVFLPKTGKQLVLENASYAKYVNSSHLIFVRDNVLMVAPFDLGQLKPGRAVRLVNDEIEFDYNKQTPQIAISDNGTTIYVTDSELYKRELVWVDHQGKPKSLEAGANVYEGPCLSPNGRQIAVGIRSQKDPNIQVYVYNIRRNIFRPLTMESESCYPQWSPDGTQIAFWGREPGSPGKGVFCKSLGEAEPKRLASEPSSEVYLHPYSWSMNLLACTAWDPNTQEDIWIVDTNGKQEPKRILSTEHREYNPAFSPNGRWLAYVSEKSGQPEIYLWEYPTGEKLPVSTRAATNPVWSRDGQELYYISSDNMMVVKVTQESDFPIGVPVPLFKLPDEIESDSRGLVRSYDVSNEGQFLMLKLSDRPDDQLIYVQNWFEELKRLAPPRKDK